MGIPGSLIAAGLVEMKGRWLGRRGAMAVSTLLTGVFIFLFSSTKEAHATLGFECVVSLTQNAMYGILFAVGLLVSIKNHTNKITVHTRSIPWTTSCNGRRTL